MANVLLVIQLLISIVLTFLILIQRSEGGALGIGGGGGGGSFMSGRSATNSISRMTAILGALFIINCMVLSVVFNKENQSTSIIDVTNAEAPLTIAPETSDETNPLDDAVEAPVAVEETPQTDDETEAATSEDPKKPEGE